MSKRTIRKLRHLPIARAAERSPNTYGGETPTARRARVLTDRAQYKKDGAEFRARKGGRDERKVAAVAAAVKG